MNTKFFLSASAFFLCISFADANTLARWSFENIDLDENDAGSTFPLESPELGADVASAVITLGNGVGLNNSDSIGQYGFSVDSADTTMNLADATLANHFIQFDLNADPGSTLNLDSLDLNGRSDGNGAADVALVYSLAGFAEGTSDATTLVTRNGVQGQNFLINLDLSGSDFQGLSSVTFRLYGWNTAGPDGFTSLVDPSAGTSGLTINGLSAIPEISSTLPLAGLFAFTVLGFRKRRM